MGDIPTYELRDGDDVIRVKPCRACYEMTGRAVVPYFVVDNDIESLVPLFSTFCPKCRNGMIQLLHIDRLQERWNNWEQPLQDWIDDLDW